MYYIYEWFIVETGEIFYVGKGTHLRYRVRKHNQFFNDMIKRYHCDSRIIKEFETEKEAFDYEFERIAELKSQGQCVCNISKGGVGGSTKWWTDELKDTYSRKNVMKSEDQRNRMKKNNPMKDPQIAEKANAQKRKAVIINGVEFKSVKEVRDHYGVSQTTVNEWCRKGRTSFGEPCSFKDNKGEFYTLRNNGQPRAVTYKGKHYRSSTELAIAVGVAQVTASRWCRNGFDPYGEPCRYDEDTRTQIVPTGRKNIAVIVNGKRYESKEKARKELGITAYTLTQYLEGKLKSDKYVCEYVKRSQ